jgi:pheromone shutdown-related protein TraB
MPFKVYIIMEYMNTGTSTIIYNSNHKTLDTPIDMSRIILVGTAHVSDKSVIEVNEVIDREKPDIVAVELCKGRYNALKGKEEIKEINIKDLLSGNKFYYFLMHWLLAYVQKKFGKEHGVKPGAEMLSAIEKAEKTNAHIALIDRDIQITLARFWNKMSFFEKLKLFGSLISGMFSGTEDIDMDKITDEDVVSQLVSELRKIAPTAASVLLDERNAIMAKNLLDLSREGKVVAVVGAGHREGIQKYLDAPESIPPIEELMVIPKKRFSWIKAAAIGLSIIVIGLLALFVYSGTVSLLTLLTMLLILFITKGILSAVGVILARGHSISVLTAFSLAWSGFLHPWLPVGWLAGIVEAHYRPPMTEDFKNIMKTESIKELMQNRLFRILLVAGLANFGSMLGTLVAIPIMVHYLGIPNPLEIPKIAFNTGLKLVENML